MKKRNFLVAMAMTAVMLMSGCGGGGGGDEAASGDQSFTCSLGSVAAETSNQIEAARIAMTRSIKRGGKVWIKIFPDKPITKKPAETRMGKGKGAPEYWVAVVKPGRVMFEISGVAEEVAREALRLASHKLPVQTKFVKRETVIGGDQVEE